MATQGQIAKSQRKPKFSTRIVHRCWQCGRTLDYMSKFTLSGICFRELANAGRLPGVRKSSW